MVLNYTGNDDTGLVWGQKANPVANKTVSTPERGMR